jgi:xylulokinase
VVLAKDYLRLKLTCEYAANVTDASATALFSVQDRSWAGEMLDAIEIPKDWLPKAYESATVSGRVTSRAAELIGLSAGIPVVAGGGDDAKSALGCGAVETGIIASSIGTSGILMAVSNRSVADHKRRVDMFCHAIPQKWQFIGVTYSAGASLRWFNDAFCDSERAAANNRGVNVYDLLCSEANVITQGDRDPIGRKGLPSRARRRCSSTGKPCLRSVEI